MAERAVPVCVTFIITEIFSHTQVICTHTALIFFVHFHVLEKAGPPTRVKGMGLLL